MKRVLVVRIGRLGDAIMATPVIEVLQKAYGADLSIDFAASPGASAYILEMDQRINRVFPIAHRSAPWRFHRVKRELAIHSHAHPYDLVINLECGNECDDFIRFVNHREFCGRPLVQPRHQADRHCVDTEKSIYADMLGAAITADAETSLQLQLDSGEIPVAAGSDYVVINPGFSGIQKPGYRSHRAWPLAHWQSLLDLFRSSAGLSVLINGTTDEQREFASLLSTHGVYSLFGSSIPTLASALDNAKALITVDTGTMHLATALKTPVIALFGPTNPVLTGPYSHQVPNKVLVSGIDCHPCVGTREQKKCVFNRCMSELEPVNVFNEYQKLTTYF